MSSAECPVCGDEYLLVDPLDDTDGWDYYKATYGTHFYEICVSQDSTVYMHASADVNEQDLEMIQAYLSAIAGDFNAV